MLADAFKLHTITYDGNTGVAPSSVAVEIANQVKERRDFALLGNVYLNTFETSSLDQPASVL